MDLHEVKLWRGLTGVLATVVLCVAGAVLIIADAKKTTVSEILGALFLGQ